MNIEAAQKILDGLDDRCVPLSVPRLMYLDGYPPEGVMCIEVEGYYTAEEFEAMAVVLRNISPEKRTGAVE